MRATQAYDWASMACTLRLFNSFSRARAASPWRWSATSSSCHHHYCRALTAPSYTSAISTSAAVKPTAVPQPLPALSSSLLLPPAPSTPSLIQARMPFQPAPASTSPVAPSPAPTTPDRHGDDEEVEVEETTTSRRITVPEMGRSAC